MGAREKKLLAEMEPILLAVLRELKTNGKIKTIYYSSEVNMLMSVLEKLNYFTDSLRVFSGLGDEKKLKEFLAATSRYGFTENNTLYMHVACAVTIVGLSTELFKLRLLFRLKDVSHDVSRFERTMKEAAPTTWPSLQPYVDSSFRNAIAHGNYAIRIVNGDPEVVLLSDAKLLPSNDQNSVMSLDEFMIRVKECNVLYECLRSVLQDLTSKGFFKS